MHTSNSMHTRYYGLMWTALIVATLIFIAHAAAQERNMFQPAILILVAVSAFRGKITSARWLLCALAVIQAIGALTILFLSEATLKSIFTESRQFAFFTVAFYSAVYCAMYVYATSLEKRAPDGATERIPDVIGEPISLDNNTAWNTALKYFPELGELYSHINCIDTEYAARFKMERLKHKDFSNAQREYWRVLNEIASDTCGVGNAASRSFLLSAINNGDYATARRFISLSRKLGAESMNDSVLARFKASSGDATKSSRTELEEQWQYATKHYPQIAKHYERLKTVSPKHANTYRAALLDTPNFQSASEVFESTVDEIVNDHCRGPNWQPREYLQKAIIRGKSDIARQFIEFAQKIGPENVDNAALNRFRRSIDPLWDRDDG